MANLINALRELTAERSRTQAKVEQLDQAIAAIESLNGSAGPRSVGPRSTGTQRVVSVAARRKMALAQRARRARERKGAASSTASSARKPLSIAARRRIAAAQKKRWAKFRAEQKAA